MKETTLVILAAGMGSRYGGLKQLDHMGPNGETLLEYGVYDAIEAGFDRVLFIVREVFEQEFRKRICDRIGNRIKVDTVCQEVEKLPAEYRKLAVGREKPWGTGHALWCAAADIRGPFGVINADDYYGREALKTLREFLNSTDSEKWAGLVGYRLGKTLSDNGTVSRGIIFEDTSNRLAKVRECVGLAKRGNFVRGNLDGEEVDFPDEQLVSMNCFGFGLPFLELLDQSMNDFLASLKEEKKKEFYLPEVLNALTSSGGNVTVMDSESEWMGVTYAEDKEIVQSRLKAMVKANVYPENLWA